MSSPFWSYTDATEAYREPTWRCISNVQNPKDHSADNLLLFSATHLLRLNVLGRQETEGLDDVRALLLAEKTLFYRFVRACEITPGTYHRYPGATDGPTTFDDLIGLCTVSRLIGLPFAQEIYAYAWKHLWKWNDSKNPFEREYRIPHFPGTVRICAGRHPWPWEESGFVVARQADYFEPKAETNGRCLLMLGSWACYKSVLGLPRVDVAIEDWWKLMQAKFPGGPREVYGEYFHDHPLASSAPTRFGPVWGGV